jgi:hypothetical protein
MSMTQRTRRLFPMVALSLSALTTACGGIEAGDKVAVQFSPSTKEVSPEAEGDVKITSTDGALVLAVIGDSVVIQLSDSLRNSVADSVKAKTNEGGAIAALIGDAVGAAVKTAMGFKARVPAHTVENLRFEDGQLRFNVKGSTVNVRGTGSNSETTGRFTESDANRFIEAVKAAQQRGQQM